ncbi:MAG: hypothetical protein JXB49_26175 [Bacteroidales bacterium]|nr:hypothetical protein [Bacteroidales bacterium]
MKLINTIQSRLADPLYTFRLFERSIAAFCVLIPFILWLTDGGFPHPFRPSISQYALMNNSYVFGMLLSIAAMLFIFNGAVYFNNQKYMHISENGQWYNVLLGLSLLGVIVFPCCNCCIDPCKQHLTHCCISRVAHFVFAGIFFIGNALVTAFFHKDKDKIISIIMAILTIASLPLAIFHVISLLVAEWISLTVISVHFILSTFGMDQLVNNKKAKVLLMR